ncbi:hypothetical protein EYB39_22525 [Pantoea agglomerans]|nr:hypothetical protein EYB39_22525 [Pantoea agglomerans]
MSLVSNPGGRSAEWEGLLSTLFIVPLFFIHEASELIKIGMQLLCGTCVSRAAFLANGGWNKKNHVNKSLSGV